MSVTLVLLIILVGWVIGIGGYAYHRNLDERFKELEHDLIDSIESSGRHTASITGSLGRDVEDLRRDLDAMQMTVNDFVLDGKE